MFVLEADLHICRSHRVLCVMEIIHIKAVFARGFIWDNKSDQVGANIANFTAIGIGLENCIVSISYKPGESGE